MHAQLAIAADGARKQPLLLEPGWRAVPQERVGRLFGEHICVVVWKVAGCASTAELHRRLENAGEDAGRRYARKREARERSLVNKRASPTKSDCRGAPCRSFVSSARRANAWSASSGDASPSAMTAHASAAASVTQPWRSHVEARSTRMRRHDCETASAVSRSWPWSTRSRKRLQERPGKRGSKPRGVWECASARRASVRGRMQAFAAAGAAATGSSARKLAERITALARAHRPDLGRGTGVHGHTGRAACLVMVA